MVEAGLKLGLINCINISSSSKMFAFFREEINKGSHLISSLNPVKR